MRFKVNGVEYEGAKYDFNTHCEFDAMGINVMSVRRRPLPVIRAYLAISTGMDLEEAGKELEQEFLKGGDFSDIMNCLAKECNNSDFFMKLVEENQKAAEEKTEEPEEEAPKEKTKRGKTTKKNEENTEV